MRGSTHSNIISHFLISILWHLIHHVLNHLLVSDGLHLNNMTLLGTAFVLLWHGHVINGVSVSVGQWWLHNAVV